MLNPYVVSVGVMQIVPSSIKQSSLIGNLARVLHGTADASGLRRKSQVFGRSLAGTVGSNPAGGMDVCLL